MKEVTIVQQKVRRNIKFVDDDSTDLSEYTKRLSNVLSGKNVVILEATSGCYILRPDQISLISVVDLNTGGNDSTKPIKKIKQQKVHTGKKEILEGEIAGSITDA